MKKTWFPLEQFASLRRLSWTEIKEHVGSGIDFIGPVFVFQHTNPSPIDPRPARYSWKACFTNHLVSVDVLTTPCITDFNTNSPSSEIYSIAVHFDCFHRCECLNARPCCGVLFNLRLTRIRNFLDIIRIYKRIFLRKAIT